MLFAIAIVEEEKKPYMKILYSNKSIIDSNHAIFLIYKEKLVKILQLKREVFCIKTTIWKSEENRKYALPNFYGKIN